MARRIPYSLCVASAALGFACATTQARDTTSAPTAELALQFSSSRDIIGREEVRKSTGTNAYDVVAQLRPEFLRNRVAAPNDTSALASMRSAFRTKEDMTYGYPTVYVNNVRLGGPGMLRSIAVETIVRIRYFKEPGIPVFYGPNNPGGIIEVTTKI